MTTAGTQTPGAEEDSRVQAALAQPRRAARAGRDAPDLRRAKPAVRADQAAGAGRGDHRTVDRNFSRVDRRLPGRGPPLAGPEGRALDVGILGADLTVTVLDQSDLATAEHGAGALHLSGLRKDQAQAVYRVCQGQEQAWREKLGGSGTSRSWASPAVCSLARSGWVGPRAGAIRWSGSRPRRKCSRTGSSPTPNTRRSRRRWCPGSEPAQCAMACPWSALPARPRGAPPPPPCRVREGVGDERVVAGFA